MFAIVFDFAARFSSFRLTFALCRHYITKKVSYNCQWYVNKTSVMEKPTNPPNKQLQN